MNYTNVLARVRRETSPWFRRVTLSRASTRALESLCQTYRERKLCLFTGAGVSFTESVHYRAPGWWDLLSEVCCRVHADHSKHERSQVFESLRNSQGDAWHVASALARAAGGEKRFLATMRRSLVGRTGRDGRYKRLPKEYLDKAGTLNAVLAFCSRLRAFRQWPCYVPSPNVHAILTLNYDWFLEGGGTQKYNANRFKPMASLRSRLIPGSLPVYHVHGYVPHGVRRKPKYPLVLTAESYRFAYQPNTFTRLTIDNHLTRFSTVFVGVSFDDEPLLQRIHAASRSGGPSHYAFLKEGCISRERLNRLRAAGVQTILYGTHKDIPVLLGRVYQAGMDATHCDVRSEKDRGGNTGKRRLQARDYWAMLLFNKP